MRLPRLRHDGHKQTKTDEGKARAGQDKKRYADERYAQTKEASAKMGVKFQKVCPIGLFTACNSWACGTPPKRCPRRTPPASHPVVLILSTLMHTSHRRHRPLA